MRADLKETVLNMQPTVKKKKYIYTFVINHIGITKKCTYIQDEKYAQSKCRSKHSSKVGLEKLTKKNVIENVRVLYIKMMRVSPYWLAKRYFCEVVLGREEYKVIICIFCKCECFCFADLSVKVHLFVVEAGVIAGCQIFCLIVYCHLFTVI